MGLLHASTCFEHMCSSSGGQNCTIYIYKFYYCVFKLTELYFSNFSYFSNFRPLTCLSCDDTSGCIVQF